ncbi:hypothetical protein AAFC00_003536 [Neodothiora populina]|uniref:U3 small nucleolar RNA-associated protein 10 n=1 Tax=Neodothiora populina TaxID=2781224 RepID=A0ABR3PEI4_9PEZI
MATALQQQLAQIARTSTKQLDLKAQRVQHSKSLLFEARDAANQTFDTLYQICSEGFRELCLLDPRFTPFAQNLFSEQSKGEDRGQMTAQENQELDKVIDAFLALVGARILLRPAIKAVEWLVRRFRAHEYNTESLILNFLPYHANPVFATLLSILPKNLSPAFKFLHPYMTSLSCPPRHALLYAATTNPSFFSSLNSHILRIAAQGYHSAPALGFWASITAQAINGQLDAAQSGRPDVRRQREEDLLLRVLPILHNALRIKNVPELFLGSCTILTILVTKAQLQDKVLDALMHDVVKSTAAQTLDDSLTCLAVIAEERQSHALPTSVARSLLKFPALSQHVSTLAGRQCVSKLSLGLALAVLYQPTSDDQLDLVQRSLDPALLTSQQRSVLASALLSATPKLLELHPRNTVASLFTSICESPTNLALIRQEAPATGLDVESLELQLQISFPDANLPAIEAPMDLDKPEVALQSDKDLLDQRLAALPASLDGNYSFLAAADPKLFDSCAQASLALVRTKAKLSALFENSPFRASSPLDVTGLSLLLRLWSSKTPAVVRNAALKATAELLRADISKALDAQALLPYLLIALSDNVENVRRSAADLLILLSTLYQPSGDKGKVAGDLKVWGREQLYGERSKDITWLSSQDAYKILSAAILPSLEECVLDQAHVARVLKTSLNGSSEAQSASASGIELKSSLRASLYSLICGHAVGTSSLDVRVQLLSFLVQGGKAGSGARAQLLIPSVRAWATLDLTTRSTACASFQTSVQEVDGAYVACLTSRSTEEMTCLKNISSGELSNDKQLSLCAIRRFKQLWPSLKPATQIPIAIFLLDLALGSETDDVAEARQSEALETLRQLTLPTDVLTSLLDSVPSMAQMEDQPPAAKRRRTSRSELAKAQVLDPVALHAAIRKMTVVLELVEGSKPERHPDLLKGLFHVLGELQHYRTQIGSSLVYLQQLVLGCLLSIVEALEHNPSTTVDRSVLRADLIVECVRSSTSAQVHNSALLLIASLASWAPDLVLHSVMPIFTFMTNTILRQGDDYSAHIIDQTISRVVPPLASSLRKKNKDLLTGSAELLLSFTAAFEHIPLHRRLRLFSHLVIALGPRDSLAAIVAMLFEKYPSDRKVPTFAADLLGSCSASDQLVAGLKYLDLVQDALQPKRSISELVFVFNEKTPEQVEQSIVHLLQSLAGLLETQSLHSQITRGLEHGGEEAVAIQSGYAALLERVMIMSQTLKNQPRFHAASDQVLSAALSLLPTSSYILSAKSLLQKPDTDLQLLVIQSLEARSKEAKPADSAATVALIDILPSITAIISQDGEARLKHSAITCVDIIAEKFGKKGPSTVLSAAEIIASDAALTSSNDELRVISFMCLATLVDVLKDDLVSLLPGLLNTSLQYLDASGTSGSENERLHDAVYAFFASVLETLPWIIYEKTFGQALRLTQKSAGNAVIGPKCVESREQFYALASKQLNAKDLLLAIDGTLESGLSCGYRAAQETLHMLHKIITHQTKATLIKQAPTLFSILTKSFDLRRQSALLQGGALSDAEVIGLEEQRNNLTLDAIMKLNDATFRPFFMRLVTWAAEGLPKKDQPGRLLRLTSLYSFLGRFFEALKSVVTSYSSYLLEQAAEMLNNINPNGDVERAVLSNLLTTLSCSFRHDQDDFWQAPAHFEAVAHPLLTQLSHDKDPEIRESLNIIPAITGLASAAASPEHHKALNSALLKLMRHEDALVRLAAVKCEQNLTDRLGEDWLALLPEMLPFISELQEDDDEVVERETLAWIRQIEGILGESLEGMLQ